MFTGQNKKVGVDFFHLTLGTNDHVSQNVKLSLSGNNTCRVCVNVHLTAGEVPSCVSQVLSEGANGHRERETSERKLRVESREKAKGRRREGEGQRGEGKGEEEREHTSQEVIHNMSSFMSPDCSRAAFERSFVGATKAAETINRTAAAPNISLVWECVIVTTARCLCSAAWEN